MHHTLGDTWGVSDNFAHFFGFLGGLLIGTGSLPARNQFGRLHCRQIFLAVVSWIVFIALAVILVGVLYTRVDPHRWCTFCHYISCVPTPWWKCA
jgi:hypothetical protein